MTRRDDAANILQAATGGPDFTVKEWPEPASRDTEIERPFEVRLFEGRRWVSLDEAARLHEAHQTAMLEVVSLRNEAILRRSQPASEPSLDVDRLARNTAELVRLGARLSAPSLDVAWKEAEAALPEGWIVAEVSTASEMVVGRWHAKAVLPRDDPEFGRVYDELVYGDKADSPAAALQALAARLSQPADNEAAATP